MPWVGENVHLILAGGKCSCNFSLFLFHFMLLLCISEGHRFWHKQGKINVSTNIIAIFSTRGRYTASECADCWGLRCICSNGCFVFLLQPQNLGSNQQIGGPGTTTTTASVKSVKEWVEMGVHGICWRLMREIRNSWEGGWERSEQEGGSQRTWESVNDRGKNEQTTEFIPELEGVLISKPFRNTFPL